MERGVGGGSSRTNAAFGRMESSTIETSDELSLRSTMGWLTPAVLMLRETE
jgi:hypothetical protein